MTVSVEGERGGGGCGFITKERAKDPTTSLKDLRREQEQTEGREGTEGTGREDFIEMGCFCHKYSSPSGSQKVLD